MISRLCLVLGLACFLAAPASAGQIRGQLWMSKKAAASARPASSDAGSAAASVEALVRHQRGVHEAVIWVEEVPAKVEQKIEGPKGWKRWFGWLPMVSTEPEPRVAHLVQRGEKYAPRVLVTRVGDGVELSNADRVYHNTFSVSPARKFDLGKYAPGWRDTLTFAKTGVVNLHCDLHPREIAYVVVVPNLVHAAPDSLGRFKLPSLPEGSYRLRYWHPQHGERRMGVVVPRRGNVALELSF